MEEKVKFKDLSAPLKTGMIVSWIVGVLYAVLFTVGFVIGIMGD